MKSSSTALTALIPALALLCAGATASPKKEAKSTIPEIPPAGVKQVIPRGDIPAIFDPVFVGASEAQIPDDAWVLGVAIGAEAHAYSLNLLNSHEVVNDRIGEKNFAAVW